MAIQSMPHIFLAQVYTAQHGSSVVGYIYMCYVVCGI